MPKDTYTIKEASEILDLESHTLRYYEDELDLDIPRNSMGHRYYRNYDIKVFEYIIKLKEQGLQLKAIRDAIRGSVEDDIYTATAIETPNLRGVLNTSQENIDITDRNNEKVEQFRLMIKDTFIQAIEENHNILKLDLESHINEIVKSDIQSEIKKIESMYEQRDRERYKQLDETMRQMQEIRKDLNQKEEDTKNNKSIFSKIFKKRDKKIEAKNQVLES